MSRSACLGLRGLHVVAGCEHLFDAERWDSVRAVGHLGRGPPRRGRNARARPSRPRSATSGARLTSSAAPSCARSCSTTSRSSTTAPATNAVSVTAPPPRPTLPPAQPDRHNPVSTRTGQLHRMPDRGPGLLRPRRDLDHRRPHPGAAARPRRPGCRHSDLPGDGCHSGHRQRGRDEEGGQKPPELAGGGLAASVAPTQGRVPTQPAPLRSGEVLPLGPLGARSLGDEMACQPHRYRYSEQAWR